MAHRLSKYCEEQGIFPESACGFRIERSTVDMLFVVKLLQQTCKEKNIPLYLAFLDITKAYDSVHRPTLWKILHAIGIPPLMLALFSQLYDNANCRVRFNGKYSKCFCLQQGLKQGCPAACTLFNIFLQL
jgi:hypothetical protein